MLQVLLHVMYVLKCLEHLWTWRTIGERNCPDSAVTVPSQTHQALDVLYTIKAES